MTWSDPVLKHAIKHWLADISNFSRLILHRPLRSYQLAPAHAILESILHGRGLTFAVMMSRQSGAFRSPVVAAVMGRRTIPAGGCRLTAT